MIPLHATADRARHSSEVAALREPAYALVGRMEQVSPATQFNALMLAAYVAAEALGLDPHEELSRAGRKVAAAEGPFTAHIQALRDYVRGELQRA